MRFGGTRSGRRWHRGAAIGALAASLFACACATSAPRRGPASPLALPDHPRVALLPLENLTGQTDAAEVFGRLLFTELVRTGCCDPIEPGLVEEALDSLGIRYTGALTAADTRGIARRLNASYVMVGTVLEVGSVRTSEGDVPSAAATLRMLAPDSARVVWANAGYRTGQDRESVFGYGRERSSERLQAALAAELLRPFWPEGALKGKRKGR